MAKLLYIQASPRGQRSQSNQVAQAFLDAYKQKNPDDIIEKLNVFEADLPSFDGLAVQAKYTIMHGAEHTQEELQAWKEIENVIEQFKSADKYVLSVPMWNFSIPYKLKQYIDIIVQPGYTFSYDSQKGYTGLVTGKPLLVIYARGGQYAEGTKAQAYDLQKRYIEQIFGFMGFGDIKSIIVEPTLAAGAETAQARLKEAVEQAEKSARYF
ncbi:MAG: NAD(P)H-dependent oxidoreductase [Sedimentisphaerales bacterium]|nr:NAD(P)H-dependent oxidoreductase [Sedimentisphaerales bacterium]